MIKIETTLDKVREEILKFFVYDKYILNVIQGIDCGDKIEIQWLFSHRENKNEMTLVVAFWQNGDVIPTIVDFAPNSWIFESELVDLFGTDVEGAKRGLFLDIDGKVNPLKKS
jgi:Ni,Fe-hydrogenase III component G